MGLAVSQHQFNRTGKTAARADSCNEKLEAPLESLFQFIEAIPAGVLWVDQFGVVKTANTIAENLLGENLSNAIWREVIQRVFQPQKDDGLEVSLRNGKKIKLSISTVPGYPGQLIHLTDLTETRKLQSKVGHMQKLYSLGKMVASLAHQIRTPLSAALLYAENLKNPRIDRDSTVLFCSKLSARLRDLEAQVNDMLLFAKKDSNQVVETLSIAGLVDEVVNEGRELAAQNGCTLHAKLTCKNKLILGNKTALKGGLHNLLQNAVQAGASRLEIVVSESNKKQLKIDVADNGRGIANQKQASIFEPFYTTRTQGTGLGLAVVQSVIKSHHGSIHVASKEGAGTTFSILLPVQNNGSPNKEAGNNRIRVSEESQSTTLPFTQCYTSHDARQENINV